ncbi:MAG: hypothetical protein ACLS3M_01890 [Collinsella sp.]
MHSTPLWAHSRSSWVLSPASRVVGGIGIMNMMLTNVTERIARSASAALWRQSSRYHRAVFGRVLGTCVTGGLLGVLIGYLLAWDSRSLPQARASQQFELPDDHAKLLHYDSVDRVCRIGRHRRNLWLSRSPRGKLDPVECLRYQ